MVRESGACTELTWLLWKIYILNSKCHNIFKYLIIIIVLFVQWKNI